MITMKLRSVVNLKNVFVLTAISFALSACQDNEPLKPQTIADVISERDNLNVLRAALKHAGYSDELRTENLTFFAPTDSAFKSLGISDVNGVAAIHKDTLRRMLQYYLVPQKLSLQELAVADSVKGVKTLAKSNLFFKKKADGLYVNGSKISQGDIKTDNGLIHLMNKPYGVPSGNVLQTVKADTTLSLFYVALEELSVNTTFNAMLTSDSTSFTFLAPDNRAFRELGYPDAASIRAMNKGLLTSIIYYHVLKGRVYFVDFKFGTLGSFEGKPIVVTVNNGVKLLGRGNTDPSNVIKNDIAATNGVLHIIDRIMLP